MITLEIACNSWESCINAQNGGADRIELIENLHDGGCTPSAGLIKMSTKLSIPVYVMIRPRGGDFCYTEEEISIMETDIDICQSAGVKGIVFGCLTKEGIVDAALCERLLKRWGGPATFHRAIDECQDIFKACDTIVKLGFERILSSGGAPTAMAGIKVLTQLQNEFGEQISIMPGSGVTSENVVEIIHTTGCNEVHATCKSTKTYLNNQVKGLFQQRTTSDEGIILELKSVIQNL
jgi:copper homeostasis protein